MTVKAGDFVSWGASRGVARGRVVSVHTNSKVPAVPMSVTGTVTEPAARIRLYAPSGSGWVATETTLAHATGALSVVDAFPEPVTEAVVCGSFDDIRAQVSDAITDRIEELAGVAAWVYVCDIGPDWAVYEMGDGDLSMISYTTDATTGEIVLGAPMEVFKQTSYVMSAEPADPMAADPMMESTRADRIHGRLLAAGTTASNGGRVFRVQIIAFGDSKNARRYNESVMRAAVPLYEGAKAFDHHRTDQEMVTSTVQGLVGHYEGVEATGHGLEADLHLLPSATHIAEAFDASLSNQSRGLAPLVGISHDVYATYKPITDAGRKLMEATAITAVNSADVVADPAAGGQATRMVAGGDPNHRNTIQPLPIQENTMTLKQLLEQLRAATSAQRAALLSEHASTIEAIGITPDDVTRMIESAPAPTTAPVVVVPVPVVESVIVRDTLAGRMIVKAAVAEAKIPESMVSVITDLLPTNFTESVLSGEIAKAVRMAESFDKVGMLPKVGHVDITTDAVDKKRKAIDDMIAGRPGGYRSLKEAYADWTGHSPKAFDTEDYSRTVLQESVIADNGRLYESTGLAQRSLESIQSTTWSLVLGDSITRRLIQMYNQPSLSTWRAVVSGTPSLNDFRTQRIDRMGGYGTLPAVLQGAPYQPLTTPSNEEITYAPTKRGGTEDLTLETIANDDVRAVQRIPQLLGLAAAQTLFRFVWDIFLTNAATSYDAIALFNAGHANTTATPLSMSALSTTRRNMRKQTAYGDTTDLLSIIPKFLIVSSDLEELAFQIVTSAVALPTGAPVGAATNIPNLHQGLTPIIVDYWPSTTGWYVVADPSMVPTIEVGFYQGKQDPELFVQADPTVGSVYTSDKVTYKIRHIYGGTVLDHRGLARGNA